MMKKIESFFGFDDIVGLIFYSIATSITIYAIYLSYQKHDHLVGVLAVILAILFSTILISNIKRFINRSKKS